MSEIWKDVVGYEGLYQVSDCGNVRGIKRIDSNGIPRGGFVMKPSVNCRNGYLDIGLSKDGKKRRFRVRVLVATAFHGPKPDANSVCRHRDGNKLNLAKDNLAWGTPLENSADRDAHGTTARGERNGGGGMLNESQVVEIRRRVRDGECGTTLAREFGVSKATVYDINKGRSWSHV